MQTKPNIVKFYVLLLFAIIIINVGIIYELTNIKNDNLQKISDSYFKSIRLVLMDKKISNGIKNVNISKKFICSCCNKLLYYKEYNIFLWNINFKYCDIFHF